MSVADYTTKIKEICDSLPSVNVNVKEDKMVQVFLGGLASKLGAFLNGGLHEGEYAFIFQATIDVARCQWRKCWENRSLWMGRAHDELVDLNLDETENQLAKKLTNNRFG